TKDLKNFQVYLIPEKGYKKLFAMILPMLIKFSLLIFIAMVFSGLIYGETVFSIMSSFLALVGVSCSLIAGTIISLRVLKANANAMIISMFRLVVGIGILVLSIIISAIVFKVIGVQKSIEEIVVIVELMVSLSCILSLVISIFACSSMMNGREIETK
ncbi:MAG: putative ABC exporter domain-containing protein, partial [Erysipelotrichaceae bacterium]